MTNNASAGIFARIAASLDGRAAPLPGQDVLQASDSRSDDRRRSVSLGRERVTIDRSYRGIAMRLSVPVSAYRGVSVGVRTGEHGGFVYELRLAHRDPDLSVLLDEALDESRIWAEWRASAGFFGLPALIERGDGLETWGVATASSDCHGRRPKRRLRPGIVARRAVRPEALATVHREDEIIAPE